MVSQSEIRVDEEAITGNRCRVYYAMVNEENGVLMTTTSRALAIVGCEKDIASAESHVEHALNFVKGRFYVRHDIGKKELIQKRILHMQKIRGS
jgi:phosphoribosylamine--glycine ligase